MPTLSSLVAAATTDDKVGIMTTLDFQRYIPQEKTNRPPSLANHLSYT